MPFGLAKIVYGTLLPQAFYCVNAVFFDLAYFKLLQTAANHYYFQKTIWSAVIHLHMSKDQIGYLKNISFDVNLHVNKYFIQIATHPSMMRKTSEKGLDQLLFLTGSGLFLN